MAAATDRQTSRVFALTLALAVATPLFVMAEDPDAETEETSGGLEVDQLRFRFSTMFQRGHGYQSQDGPDGEAGSEELLIFQPMALVGLRQNERVHHTLTLPVDIVSSASTDALDATTRASLWNEAGTIELETTIEVTDDDSIGTRVGYHMEEPLRTGILGVSYTRELADDNATLGVSAGLVLDWFDPVQWTGFDPGFSNRQAVDGTVSFSQVLSPTTLFAANYGVTFQTGQLATTWNSTAIEPDGPGPAMRGSGSGERFPETRLRHAVAGELLQHIPLTHTTLRGRYRYYSDDFSLDAHTVELRVAQWLGRRAYLRGSYRFHTQTGVSFYRDTVSSTYPEDEPLTSDSDLSSFDSHEWGAKLVVYVSPRGGSRGDETVEASYLRYHRTNDLDIDALSIGYGRSF